MRRGRHGRGPRGPLARGNPHGRTAPLRRRTRDGVFRDAVAAAVRAVERHCPAALEGVRVSIDVVPPQLRADQTRVPLAAAVDPLDPDQPRVVVLFQRPLELRAMSRTGLRILVRRTLVEQLSALTGRPVEDLDPDDPGGDDSGADPGP